MDADILPVGHIGGGKYITAGVQQTKEYFFYTCGLGFTFTGHSLGGALAVLAGSLVESAEVYTFGGPRVGNADFCAAVTTGGPPRYRRYVNYRDPVCHVPPRLLGYRDCGHTYFIDHAGRVIAPPPDKARTELAELQRLWDSLDRLIKSPGARRNDFTDHAPINYVSALR